MDKIKQFAPFLYKFISYDGNTYRVTFTCPKCGSHDCEKVDSIDHDCFWSGYYRCASCGNDKDARGKEMVYYSDCFVRTEAKTPQQLELF